MKKTTILLLLVAALPAFGGATVGAPWMPNRPTVTPHPSPTPTPTPTPSPTHTPIPTQVQTYFQPPYPNLPVIGYVIQGLPAPTPNPNHPTPTPVPTPATVNTVTGPYAPNAVGNTGFKIGSVTLYNQYYWPGQAYNPAVPTPTPLPYWLTYGEPTPTPKH